MVNTRKSMKNKGRSSTMIEIVKPPSDFRAYRVVILPNGITAMLISESEDEESGQEDTQVDELSYDEGEAAAALCVGVGSFCDLPEIPGFAHFMEHMVFMGSKKYPKVNCFDEFLAKNGGESNAWTDCERTCFYFVCHQNSFSKALDIFAQFFICPLFNKQSVDREIIIVDNECQMVAINDKERMRSIMSFELVEEGHPMGKFMVGNIKSLKEDPEKNNINVYEQLHTFYQKMYSAHYMTLVVHSMESLNAIEENVLKVFSKIPNNDIPKPQFIKPPFQETRINRLFKVIPMSDIHKMEIIWALPPLMDHYRARVIEFLALLLANESTGSILSFLRNKHLALDITGGNDFTGYTHNSTWSAFIMSVKLTELGIANYEEVLRTIFQYINVLKKSLPAHVFEEQKHIQEAKYIFKDQESIYSYVEELAENMQIYPPEHYLCGRTLFFEYNEQLIRACIDFLRPQGMLVMLFDKQFGSIPSLSEEPWLGVKYKVEEFDSQLIERLSNLEPNPELRIPEPNPYIATDFTLLKKQRLTKFPIVVMDSGGCRMWYKKDKYCNPNAFIYFNFISSAVARTPQNIVLGDVFLTILLHKLTEKLYSATLAGYEYSVQGTPEGIVFVIGGYSEKIKLVAQDMVHVFLEREIKEDCMTSVIAHLKQVYINELLKPVELARAIRYSLLELKDTSLLVRYEQLNHVTYELLTAFVEEFYTHLFIEGFVTGNLRPQDAVEIGDLVKTLVVGELPEEDFPKPVLMELPTGNYKCFLPGINKEDTSSCVVHYFQQGLGTIYNSCLNDVLGVAMTEPMFSVLRTENQLGYNVYCQPVITHGVIGYLLVVESQANRFNIQYIDEVMEQFQLNFVRTLQEIQPKKFKDMVEMQAIARAADDADLSEESSRFWQEIVKRSYVFDRLKLECDAMKKVSQSVMVDWYRSLISDRNRKLTVLVEGHNKKEPSMEKPEAFYQQNVATMGVRTLLKDLRKGTLNLPRNPLPRPAPATDTKEPLIKFKDLGLNYITSINGFKKTLQAYPCHMIKK